MVNAISSNEPPSQGEPVPQPSAMLLVSRKAAELAREAFAKNVQAPKSRSFQEAWENNNNLIDVISESRGFLKNVAQNVSRASSQVFPMHKVFATIFVIDAGLFNILSIFRRGLTFSSAVSETTQFWKQGNLTDKLKLLTDAAFKGVRFGESALQLAEKVSLILLFIGLSLPLACIGLITSTISSIKSLITTVGLEQKRAEFVKHIGATKGRPRIEQAISYCKRFESDIDLDNEKEKTRLLASGAQEKAIQPFLDARKKWALTGLFGSKSYPVIFQGFKKITAELDRIDQEIGALEAKPSTLGGAKHLQFMNARRDKIMGEASLWVDKFVSTLSIERTQSAASCISLMMMAAVTTISLAAFFVSIHYWLTTVVVLIVLASFIMMVNSFYNLWNQKEVSWQEKEQALDLLTAHFTEQMYKATEEDKVKLSNLFNFPIPEEISADKDLVTKEFEEHLKGILHQEKVERYINRTFVDAIQNQFKISGSKKGISSTELAKFEKDMTPFLKIIMQPQEKLLQKKLEDIAFRPTQDKSLEEKLSDAFFFYLEKLNADKPIPE